MDLLERQVSDAKQINDELRRELEFARKEKEGEKDPDERDAEIETLRNEKRQLEQNQWLVGEGIQMEKIH